MGDETDLRQQAQRKGRDHREVARLAQELGAAHRRADRLDRRCGLVAGIVFIGPARAEREGGQRPQGGQHHGDGGDAGLRKTQRVDRPGEGRREQQAAAGRPVQRQAGGQAAAAVEPLGDDGVDRSTSHGGPARSHHQEREVDLPGPVDDREGQHAQPHQAGAGQDNDPRASLLDRIAYLHHQEGAYQIEEGDGRGDDGRGPAMKLGQGHQI